MHCNLTESPDPKFQVLPLSGYVTLDELFNLIEAYKSGNINNFHRITMKD